jgi:hypothetical protein
MKLFWGFLITAALLSASEPWNKNPQNWTTEDAERILTSSPWAQMANASFGDEEAGEPAPPGPLPGAAQAGMAGSRGATDGHWDGGVGRISRTGVPSLPILIRWDSALPVREAAVQSRPDVKAATAEQAAKDYVITIIGLVPAKRYRDSGRLSGTSESDDSVDARDPEDLLEGLMGTTRLIRRGRPALAPENVRIDGVTGTVHVFFPRTDPIVAAEKEVVFRTRFGSLTIEKSFRLKDMVYKRRLDL